MWMPVFHLLCAIALALPQTAEVALRQIVVSSEQEALQLRARMAVGAPFDDARVARSLDALANVYRLQGRAADAEQLYRRGLALLERMGAPDLEVAQVLSGLGMSLVKQLRFAEAQPLYERARLIRAK